MSQNVVLCRRIAETPLACDVVSTISPILPGAEPISIHGGGDGVLLIHGFTGNPFSMRGIVDRLQGLGMSIEAPLLPGHGTDILDMLPTRWDDWREAADEEYTKFARRCEKVVVLGHSMGGTLACWLGEQYSAISGLVLINPLIVSRGTETVALIEEAIEAGTELAPGIGSDIARPDVVELSYDQIPLRAVLSLFNGADQVCENLSKIRCPTLLLSSRLDHVVDPISGDKVLEAVSGTVERVWLERSYHVATLDYDAELVEESTTEFVSKIFDEANK